MSQFMVLRKNAKWRGVAHVFVGGLNKRPPDHQRLGGQLVQLVSGAPRVGNHICNHYQRPGVQVAINARLQIAVDPFHVMIVSAAGLCAEDALALFACYAPLLRDRFDLTFVEVFLIFFSPTLPVVFITDFLIMQIEFSKFEVSKSNLSSVNFEIPKSGFSEHKADKLP